jgi:carbamoyl-phosphate synthase large subunit
MDDIERGDVPLPVIVKPATGSGSVGIARAATMGELRHHLDTVPNAIVQEIATGDEYTLDILADFGGTPRCVVPRKRIEVRAGEVSKAVTVRNERLIAAGRRIVDLLPGARGPLNLQCFLAEDGRLAFIEINPRFGGGFPLSAAAGAHFPRWIIEWVRGGDPEIGPDDWQDGLYMLRYDEGLFVSGDQL